MAVATATITRKYQITIPAEVRRRLGLQVGDTVYLDVRDDEVVLRAVPGGWADSMVGLGADLWRRHGGGEAVIRRERDSWDDRP